ncbi:TPA: hypothetical protein HA246_07625 [Candidatus Woesearchaeota archaeon]|nr:hypothetical protein [Candidatus Woesearchaeota archaeon]
MSIDKLRNLDGSIDADKIEQIIPYHRPFLLVDKILFLDRNKLTAVKQLKKDDFFFNGHFTDFPIMPVSMMIEGLGQAATLLIRYTIEQNLPKYVLAHNVQSHNELEILAHKANDLVLNKPSFPGDTLRYEINLVEIDERRATLFGRIIKERKTIVSEKEQFIDEEIGQIKLVFGIVNRKEFRARAINN